MDDDETIEYPARPRRRWRLPLVLAVLAVFFGAGTTASYYVDALWFGSLGYAVVFWKALNIQAIVFGAFAAATFAALYGAFLALKPPRFGEPGSGGVIFVNGRPVALPIGPILRAGALLLSLVAGLAAGATMMSGWDTLQLWGYGGAPPASAGARSRGGGWGPRRGRVRGRRRAIRSLAVPSPSTCSRFPHGNCSPDG